MSKITKIKNDAMVHDSLESALAAAQANVKSVAHDGKNDYSRYNYTTAEAMVKASISLFGDQQLAFDRKSYEFIVKHNLLMIKSVFNLTHGSTKEISEYTGEWPVVEKKGTPMDKALAAALTSSFAYIIRDVLKIPRLDEKENMDRRDDTEHKPNPHQPKPFQRPQQLKEEPEPSINKSRKWPEMVEKYKPLLPLVNMSLIEFGNLTPLQFKEIQAKIEKTKLKEIAREG